MDGVEDVRDMQREQAAFFGAAVDREAVDELQQFRFLTEEMVARGIPRGVYWWRPSPDAGCDVLGYISNAVDADDDGGEVLQDFHSFAFRMWDAPDLVVILEDASPWQGCWLLREKIDEGLFFGPLYGVPGV